MASLTRTRAKPPSPGWGMPHTFDPANLVNHTGAAVANDAMYFRVRDSGIITKIGIIGNVSSGNISLAVLRGPMGMAPPTTRLATTGAVACPAGGYNEISLGASVAVDERTDWFALSIDNTTATFGRVGNVVAESGLGAGFCYRGTAHHPIPASPTGLVASIRVAYILVGRP